jgi:acetyl esterase/lipase
MNPIPLLIALATTVTASAGTVSFKDARSEVYKTASDTNLRLYFYDPEGHDPKRDRRPAIVFFFGGGWSSGSPAQFEQHACYLAQRGMVAVVADYRVKSRQKTSPRECVADGHSAVRYLRQNARRLGIDPDRIAAGGGSAGGHVAATTGMCDGLEDPDDMLEETISAKSNALVLFNPVYDNGPKGYGHSRVKEWFPAISPAHNISRDDPPAIVFLGTKDNLIPVATAKKFQADMEKVGLKSELHLYEGQPHGFFNESRGGPEVFADTLRKMDTFLVEVGYLEGTADEKAIKAVSGKGGLRK